MTKAKEDKKSEIEAPKVPLPEILKKRSMFSGGSAFGKSPASKFTPKTFRVTQHRGG